MLDAIERAHLPAQRRRPRAGQPAHERDRPRGPVPRRARTRRHAAVHRDDRELARAPTITTCCSSPPTRAPRGSRRLAGRALCDAIVLMDIEAARRAHPGGRVRSRVPVVLDRRPGATARACTASTSTSPLAARLAVDELAALGHDRRRAHRAPGRGRSSATSTTCAASWTRRAPRPSATGCRYEVIAPVEPTPRRREGPSSARSPRAATPGSASSCPTRRLVAAGAARARCARAASRAATSPSSGCARTSRRGEREPPVTNVSAEPRDVSRRAMQTLVPAARTDRRGRRRPRSSSFRRG